MYANAVSTVKKREGGQKLTHDYFFIYNLQKYL